MIVSLIGCLGPAAQPNATASQSPSTQPAGTPTPLPSAEKLVPDSFVAMQRVVSAKGTQRTKGAFRVYSSRSGQTQTVDTASTSSVEFQSSPDHRADASRSEAESLFGTKRSVTRSVRIGRLTFFRTEDPDATPNPAPSVIPHGLWTPSLSKDPFVFPDPTFGKFGQFAIQNTPPVVPSAPQVNGVELRGGVAAYELSSAGTLSDSGQQLLRGGSTETLWIATDTLLWLRWERTRKYDDGASYSEAIDYSDYNVPNVISAPRTNPSATFVPAAVSGPPDRGSLRVRICLAPIAVDPMQCTDTSRVLPGITLSLSGGDVSPVRTTDASGVAVFEDVPIYVSYQLRVGCGPTGFTNVAVPAGVINAGGRTDLPLAVCH